MDKLKEKIDNFKKEVLPDYKLPQEKEEGTSKLSDSELIRIFRFIQINTDYLREDRIEIELTLEEIYEELQKRKSIGGTSLEISN